MVLLYWFVWYFMVSSVCAQLNCSQFDCYVCLFNDTACIWCGMDERCVSRDVGCEQPLGQCQMTRLCM